MKFQIFSFVVALCFLESFNCAELRFSDDSINKCEYINPVLKALIGDTEKKFRDHLISVYADEAFNTVECENIINSEMHSFTISDPVTSDQLISYNVMRVFPLLRRSHRIKGEQIVYRDHMNEQSFSTFMDKVALKTFNKELHDLIIDHNTYFNANLILLISDAGIHFNDSMKFKAIIKKISNLLVSHIPDIVNKCSIRNYSLADHLNCFLEQIYLIIAPEYDPSNRQNGQTQIHALDLNLLNLIDRAIIGNWYDSESVSSKYFYESVRFLNFRLLKSLDDPIKKLDYNWEVRPGEEIIVKSADLIDKICQLGTFRRVVKEYQNNKNSRVTHEKDLYSGDEFVLKGFKSNKDYERERDFILRIEKHQFFLKCYGSLLSSLIPTLVYECIENGCSKAFAKTASLEQLKMISAQLFSALEYLHSLGFVHDDVKAENVLIERGGTVKLIDFGSTFKPPAVKRSFGSPASLSPEKTGVFDEEVDEATDWWAYGNTVGTWHNLSFNVIGDEGIYAPIYFYERRYHSGIISREFSPELRRFLAIFLQPNPKSRRFVTPRQLQKIRDDPFFEGVNWDLLSNSIL